MKKVITLLFLILIFTQSSFAGSLTPLQIQHQVERDIMSMTSLLFSNSTIKSKSFFGPSLSGKILVKFIQDRISELIFTTETHGNTPAITYGNRVVIYPAYLKLPETMRWGALLHEARHADPLGEFDHVTCPTPFSFNFDHSEYLLTDATNVISGLEACDSDDEGAYSVEGTFYINVALYCTNCSAKKKETALSEFFADGVIRITDPISAERFVKDNLQNEKTAIPYVKSVLNNW
jgi:hypothetical protein